jgi:hypothetical protein
MTTGERLLSAAKENAFSAVSAVATPVAIYMMPAPLGAEKLFFSAVALMAALCGIAIGKRLDKILGHISVIVAVLGLLLAFIVFVFMYFLLLYQVATPVWWEILVELLLFAGAIVMVFAAAKLADIDLGAK